MNEKELKLTDLDYAIGSHHLQMMKAALPYMEIAQQRTLSLFIKWNELMRTMEFFEENGNGMMSVCSLDESHVSPVDMLLAIKPYGNQREQEIIDIMTKLLMNRSNKAPGNGGPSIDQLLSILPPDQQTRFESLRLVMQTLGQMQKGGTSCTIHGKMTRGLRQWTRKSLLFLCLLPKAWNRRRTNIKWPFSYPFRNVRPKNILHFHRKKPNSCLRF